MTRWDLWQELRWNTGQKYFSVLVSIANIRNFTFFIDVYRIGCLIKFISIFLDLSVFTCNSWIENFETRFGTLERTFTPNAANALWMHFYYEFYSSIDVLVLKNQMKKKKKKKDCTTMRTLFFWKLFLSFFFKICIISLIHWYFWIDCLIFVVFIVFCRIVSSVPGCTISL